MIKFSKYHGIGNDFILLDGIRYPSLENLLESNKDFITNLSKRNFGIGANGIILSLPPLNNGKFRMRIFNSDGTEAEMCGNGIRCLVQFLIDNDYKDLNNEIDIETKAGIISTTLNKEGNINVNMGTPILDPKHIPTKFVKGSFGIPQGSIEIENQVLDVFSVSMGNPHMIIFQQELNTIPLQKWGPILEKNINFPFSTNVHFVKIINNEIIEILVWERGAGATLACGTGACASLVVCNILGKTINKAKVILPGGDLSITWPSFSSSVFMSGPAEFVYSGEVPHIKTPN